MEIGRNDKCPCGSGKKYKKCCMNADEQNKKTSFGVLRRAYTIEPNDDFFHRFLIQMSQIRDCVSPKSERSAHDESYNTIFQNLLEAKLARAHCIKLMESHDKNLADRKDAYIVPPHQITVENTIENDLGLFFKDFFIRGVMATDRLFSHCKYMGYPVSKLFDDEKKVREKAIRQFPLSKDDPRFKSLLEFIEGNQQSWYRVFRGQRVKIVHHGWKMPQISYHPTDGNRVLAVYPKIHSYDIPILLDICWDNMTNFCEELLIFIASLKLPAHLVMVEFPKEKRDPTLPVRFAVRYKEFPEADFHCS